jgi:predicted ATP-grasp superfamily ATP-dependent carboligase
MFTIKKLRQLPLELGTATLTVSTKNKEAEETVLKIIKMLNWRGFANIEFKFDHRDGKYKLIEINPRIWQQIAHAQKLGINFIMAQYLDLCSKPQPCMVIYEEEIKWINPLDDFIAAIIMLIRGEISILFWIRSLKRIRSYGLFALDDLKPFLHAIKYGAIIFGLPRFLCNILRNKNREK